jgi:hypothetical protein
MSLQKQELYSVIADLRDLPFECLAELWGTWSWLSREVRP